jgi:transposase InsO family protein
LHSRVGIKARQINLAFGLALDKDTVRRVLAVHYNHVRPHRSLGKKPPAVFANEAA